MELGEGVGESGGEFGKDGVIMFLWILRGKFIVINIYWKRKFLNNLILYFKELGKGE